MKYHFFIFLLILSACSNQNEPAEFETNAYCYEVVDGDSYLFIHDNDSIEVRHLYIDCYETYHSDRLTKQAERNGIPVDSALSLGIMAKEYVRENLKEKYVLLERDYNELNIDVYGRYLRIVFVDGERLDSILIRKNLAFKYEPF